MAARTARRLRYPAAVADLRNVIVFSVGPSRFAMELRWIREVASLGFVTTVPTAPAVIAGVCNLHGALVPVIDVGALEGGPAGPVARQGDGALVVEVDGAACALRIDQVVHISTLVARDLEVLDGDRRVPLLDGAAVHRRARELVAAAADAAVA